MEEQEFDMTSVWFYGHSGAIRLPLYIKRVNIAFVVSVVYSFGGGGAPKSVKIALDAEI